MFIPAPTRNWRAIPQEGETTVGDDVERMRTARNNLFHRPNVEVSEEEFNGFFNLFTEVGRRIDVYLNKPSSSGYEVSVKEYKTCALDKDTYEKYLNERKEMESLKKLVDVPVSEKIVHVVVGKTYWEAAENVRTLPEEEFTTVKFIIHGIEDSKEQAEMLSHLATEYGVSTENITFRFATNECIALYLDIRNKILHNEDLLAREITEFVQKFFSTSKMKYTEDEDCIVVVTTAEDDSHIDYPESDETEAIESIQAENSWCSANTLVLNLDVKNKVFKTEETLKRNVEEFVGHLLTCTNGRELIKDKEVTAVLTTEETALDTENKDATLTLNADNSSKRDGKQRKRKADDGDVTYGSEVDANAPSSSPEEEYQKTTNTKRLRAEISQQHSADKRKITLWRKVAATKKQDNYQRIRNLLYGEATLAVRVVFDREFNPTVLHKTIGQSRLVLERLRQKHVINRKRWNLLFPKAGTPSSDLFDMTLMICLLRNLTPIHIRDELPEEGEIHTGDDLSRLKFYKNLLKSTYERELSHEDLKQFWKEITSAIRRLVGNDLREKFTDLEIDELPELIPPAYKINQKREIANWERSNHPVIETNAFMTIEEMILQNNIVLVTGSFGSGKSSALHHVALKLFNKHNYLIIPVKFPSEILNFYEPKGKQVFVLDDFCGKYSLDEHRLNSWNLLSSDILSIVKEKHAKILCSSRLHILRTELRKCTVFKQIFNLADDLRLSPDEQDRFGHAYNLDKKHEAIRSYPCFPLLCRKMSENELVDAEKQIHEIMKSEFFSHLQETDQTLFATLFLFVCFDNFIPETVLQIGSKIRSVLADVSDAFKLRSQFTLAAVKSHLASLEMTYIRKVDNGYTMINNIAFDALCFCSGKYLLDAILSMCSSKFIRDRFQLDSVEEDSVTGVPKIRVPVSKEKKFFGRLLTDVRKGYITHVFTNKQLHSPEFRKKFIEHLESTHDLKKAIVTSLRKLSHPLLVSNHAYSEIGELLRKMNFAVDIRDNEGNIVLHSALGGENTKIVHLMLESDVDPNIHDT